MTAPIRVDRDWRQLAACRSVDPELFFPAPEAGESFVEQVRQAKAVCGRCQVIDTCREFALGALAHGIAGGLTADERRELRAANARPYLDSAGRLIGASRDATAETGQAQIAGGRRPGVVGHEFGVSKRTAQRWAARARATTKEGSHGGNRAPLGISQSNTQAGTAMEGPGV